MGRDVDQRPGSDRKPGILTWLRGSRSLGDSDMLQQGRAFVTGMVSGRLVQQPLVSGAAKDLKGGAAAMVGLIGGKGGGSGGRSGGGGSSKKATPEMFPGMRPGR